MSPESVITQDMRDAIGVESEPATHVVEIGAIKTFAEAIGDSNPIYSDARAALKTRYAGLIAPPTFLRSLTPGPPKVAFRAPYPDLLDGGSEWEYLGPPVRPGDRITVTSRIVDLRERTGRLGAMLFKVLETRYADQTGAAVALERNTIIHYQSSKEEAPP